MRRFAGPRAMVVVAALSVAAAGTQGQEEEPKTVRIDTLNVRDTLYHLSGGGGNTLALIDEINGGGVLVDTKLLGWGQPVLDAIGAVTDLPVTTIINTHAHAGHAGSNAEFETVVQIVAHESTKTNMARMELYAGYECCIITEHDVHRSVLATRRPRPHRPVLLRPGPHRRRHHRGVSCQGRGVRGRPISVEGDASHRHEQRRERRGVSRHTGQGSGGDPRRDPCDHGSRPVSLDVRGQRPTRARREPHVDWADNVAEF